MMIPRAFRHSFAVALPLALLLCLCKLWATNFVQLIEFGLEQKDWLAFNALALSGLAGVFML